jgi:hypothetical protein
MAHSETIMKAPAKRTSRAIGDPNRYPKRLDRKKVQKLIDYYENQTDQEAIDEAEAAYRNPKTTMMQVPNTLVPQVRRLISKRGREVQ